MKNRLITSGMILFILALAAIGCSPALARTPIETPAQNGSQNSDVVIPNWDVVENLIRAGSTYRYDGTVGSIKLLSATADAADKNWVFTVEYETSHAGHGDRTGHMMAQVITRHTAIVTVTDGEITSAVCDNSWDMLKDSAIGVAQADVQAWLGQEFNLPVGQTAAISGEDLAIRFVEVTSDSRSPKGSQTIWAGEAKCRIQITYQRATSEVTLTEKGANNGFTRISLFQYALDFQLRPYPAVGDQPAGGDYSLLLKVSK